MRVTWGKNLKILKVTVILQWIQKLKTSYSIKPYNSHFFHRFYSSL